MLCTQGLSNVINRAQKWTKKDVTYYIMIIIELVYSQQQKNDQEQFHRIYRVNNPLWIHQWNIILQWGCIYILCRNIFCLLLTFSCYFFSVNNVPLLFNMTCSLITIQPIWPPSFFIYSILTGGSPASVVRNSCQKISI